MTSDRTHRAWLLDLDGTLYRAPWVKLAMGAELALLGAGRIAVIKSFREVHEAQREELRSDPNLRLLPSPFDQQVERTARLTGRSEDFVREAALEWMCHRPGKWLRRAVRQELIAQIEQFRVEGGRTAVVSDYPASAKLEAMGLSTLFHAVVASGEHDALHRLKPSPDGYLLAASELGIQPEDCLVLGDRQDADGDAARAAGMDFRLVS